MNVLQIVPARSWGGGERYIYDLTEQLQKRGHKVSVVGRKSEIIANKFNNLVTYISLPLIFMLDIYSAIKLSGVIKKSSIDVVHVHIFKDAFMAAIATLFCGRKVKLVLTRHQVKSGKNSFLYRWLYKKLEKIIFVSKCAKEQFLSSKPDIDISKCVVVINSIDSTRLGIIAPMESVSQKPIIGFAGRISNEKGIDKLVEALAILKKGGKQFECRIAGTGDEKYVDYINTLIENEGLASYINMIGFTSDMGAFISGINIAVLPSTWVEPCSLMAIEYLASGRPLVASNRGGHSEIIEDGVDGILVEARETIDLARGLALLIDNPALRYQIGGAARKKYIDHLNFETFINNTINQYQ